MERSEINAIKSCQAGKLDNFGIIYDKYIEKIYNFIYYKTFHKETAEDLVSITFHKALKNVKKYNINDGSFSSWLYKIARNTVIDNYRTKKDHKNIEDAWNLFTNDNQEIDTDIKLKLENVNTYIGALEASQREILTMRIWSELSYKEIAEITGKSEASLKMQFSRTIKKLRKEMPLELLLILITINIK